ncbi:aminopeptidase, partial [Escherichia coli]|nr:aminopeptidase [Escherichia coli]
DYFLPPLGHCIIAKAPTRQS